MREKLTPGYLLGVWQNEIGGRYLNTLENHIHPFSFYYDSLRSFQFKKWFWTLPFCFLLGICSNDNLIRKFSQYIGLCVLSYFIIISTAQTKLQWYDMPLYPLMAIIIGLGFNQILNWMLLYISRWNYRWLMAIPLGIVIAAFVDPYKNISQKVMRDAEPPWSDKLYQISYYLKNQIDSSKNISGYKLYYEEYNLQLVFYQNVLARKQQSLELINDFNDVKEGMKIVVDKELIQARIREKFNVLTINRFKEVAVFEIISAKQSIPQNTP